MKTHELTLPVDNAQIEKLDIGDTVYLSGIVCTARDMGHLEMKQLIEQKKPLPIDLHGMAIFHAGPVCVKDDSGKWTLRVIGPTTSIRMEPHADWVGKDLGAKLIIGKGGMAQGSLDAFKQYKQAYLQAVPGCAVLLSEGVKSVKDVFWLENGMPEAMWVLNVEHFGPFIVTMDCKGNSRYEDVKSKARKVLETAY